MPWQSMALCGRTAVMRRVKKDRAKTETLHFLCILRPASVFASSAACSWPWRRVPTVFHACSWHCLVLRQVHAGDMYWQLEPQQVSLTLAAEIYSRAKGLAMFPTPTYLCFGQLKARASRRPALPKFSVSNRTDLGLDILCQTRQELMQTTAWPRLASCGSTCASTRPGSGEKAR